MDMTKWDAIQWMWEHPWAIAANAIICFGAVFYMILKNK
jgi:hypothetical protein